MVAHRKAGPNIAARRVAGEVADRVVATRLTKSEHEALVALAKGRGVSPGLLVRAWVQSAAGGVLQAVPEVCDRPLCDLDTAFDAAEKALSQVESAVKMLPPEVPAIVGDPWGEQEAVYQNPDRASAVARAKALFRLASKLHSAAWSSSEGPTAGVLQAVPTAPAAPALPEPTIDGLLDRLVVDEAEDELKRVSEEAINGLDVVRRRRRDKRWASEGIRPPADGAKLPNVGLRAVPVNDPDHSDPTSVPCPKRGCPAKRAGAGCYDSRGMALPLGRVHKERAALAARQLQLDAPSSGRRS